MAKIETAAAAQIEKGNQRTDPNAPTIADGTVGGYNRGFLDPGLRVMRVRGEPRTSQSTSAHRETPATASASARSPVRRSASRRQHRLTVEGRARNAGRSTTA